MTKQIIEKKAIVDYLIDTLVAYHRNKLEGKGFDLYFVLTSDLEALQGIIKKFNQ
jgi:hypothetical protein